MQRQAEGGGETDRGNSERKVRKRKKQVGRVRKREEEIRGRVYD